MGDVEKGASCDVDGKAAGLLLCVVRRSDDVTHREHDEARLAMIAR